MEEQPGLDLPEVLDQAVGVKIRRYGGLGSFSLRLSQEHLTTKVLF